MAQVDLDRLIGRRFRGHVRDGVLPAKGSWAPRRVSEIFGFYREAPSDGPAPLPKEDAGKAEIEGPEIVDDDVEQLVIGD